jgi:RimJ/RimL family protein N-acetyltransferase
MNHLRITQRYYATWLDVTPDRLDVPGIFAVPSPKREVRQAGYAGRFDLYAYVTDDTIIISYHRRLARHLDTITRAFQSRQNPDDIVPRLTDLLALTSPAKVHHAIKFLFTKLSSDLDTSRARQLKQGDYADFLTFHTAQYPNGEQDTWLSDYFAHRIDRGDLYGVYADGRLVSAADVPDVPYMADRVAEPGIATLAPYRRRGYAQAAAGALLKHLLSDGRVPLWSCAAHNVASRRLAENLGFIKLADLIAVTLDDQLM